MIREEDQIAKSSLRREQTPRLTHLDTFRCGAFTTIQEAENGESVWLEVIGPYCRSPELYPGGPRGQLTGSFSRQVHGAFFAPEDLLKSWKTLRIKSFWYTLMGVDRTPYISSSRLIEETKRLKRHPLALIDRATRGWLINAGCISNGLINDRWDIVRRIFDHSTYHLEDDDRRMLELFLSESVGAKVRQSFCTDGVNIQAYDPVFKRVRGRKWLEPTIPGARNCHFKVSKSGLQVLKTGQWTKKTRKFWKDE